MIFYFYFIESESSWMIMQIPNFLKKVFFLFFLRKYPYISFGVHCLHSWSYIPSLGPQNISSPQPFHGFYSVALVFLFLYSSSNKEKVISVFQNTCSPECWFLDLNRESNTRSKTPSYFLHWAGLHHMQLYYTELKLPSNPIAWSFETWIIGVCRQWQCPEYNATWSLLLVL